MSIEIIIIVVFVLATAVAIVIASKYIKWLKDNNIEPIDDRFDIKTNCKKNCRNHNNSTSRYKIINKYDE